MTAALHPATPHGAEALAAIHHAAFAAPDRWSAQSFATLLATPATFGFIHPAGALVLARTTLDDAEILTLATAPAARRTGLARTLLHAAMAEAARRGATRMLLEVAADNAPARALYARAFHLVGHRRRYYPNGADALVLEAVLEARAPLA